MNNLHPAFLCAVFIFLIVTVDPLAPMSFAANPEAPASPSTGNGDPHHPAEGPDKTAIDLIGPNGQAVQGASIPSPTGEDLPSMGRKQALLKRYYTKKVCGKKLSAKESPYIIAIRSQDMPALVKLTKQKKFRVNQRDSCGMTAIQNAILQGDAPMIQFLLDHKASLKLKNKLHASACDILKEVDDQNLASFREGCGK